MLKPPSQTTRTIKGMSVKDFHGFYAQIAFGGRALVRALLPETRELRLA